MDIHGVKPDPEAVEAMLKWKTSRTDTQLMSFLGFANRFANIFLPKYFYLPSFLVLNQ